VIVLTTAGGWGVLAADACIAADLELIRLPEDIRARVDTMVPARWSRNNPIDLAGRDRDTVPDVLDLVARTRTSTRSSSWARHPGEPGAPLPERPVLPGHGLERMRVPRAPDRRYAEAAREASERHRKPVLVATELVYADRTYGNAGPLAVREAAASATERASRRGGAARDGGLRGVPGIGG